MHGLFYAFAVVVFGKYTPQEKFPYRGLIRVSELETILTAFFLNLQVKEFTFTTNLLYFIKRKRIVLLIELLNQLKDRKVLFRWQYYYSIFSFLEEKQPRRLFPYDTPKYHPCCKVGYRPLSLHLHPFRKKHPLQALLFRYPLALDFHFKYYATR